MRIKYRAHTQDNGWMPPVEDGQIAGTFGQEKRLEAVQIEEVGISNLGINLTVHVSDIGWMDPKPVGEVAGTTGESRQIEAVKLELTGPEAPNYEVFYRLHVQDYAFLNWSKNGEINGTTGGNKRAEAIQIELHHINEHWYPVADVLNNFVDLTPPPPPAPEPQPVKESEDSMRARIVARAQSYIGYVENVGSNTSVFGQRHGDPTGEWCAYFDWSVYEDEGLAHLVPQTGYCPYAVDWFHSHPTAWWKNRGDYIPRNGDLIYFDWSPYNGVPNHTGLVEGCDGVTVCTIEGNTSDPPQVKRKYWNINAPEILGYGVPDFSQV